MFFGFHKTSFHIQCLKSRHNINSESVKLSRSLNFRNNMKVNNSQFLNFNCDSFSCLKRNIFLCIFFKVFFLCSIWRAILKKAKLFPLTIFHEEEIPGNLSIKFASFFAFLEKLYFLLRCRKRELQREWVLN